MVLVIDDNELIQEMLQLLLPSAGWRLLVARSGEEGIAQFQMHRDAVKVVLLDLHMPGMGGPLTFDALRKLAADLPIVIFTAATPAEARRHFADQPEIIILEKSCSRGELVAALTHVLQNNPCPSADLKEGDHKFNTSYGAPVKEKW